MTHDIVALGEVCEFLDSQRVPITESDRKPGPYPYYGANGQQDSIDSYIFDEPLVLLAEDGGYFGSKDRPIAYKVTGKCWVNNHAHVLRPKPNIDVDYLHRVLSYYDVTKYVNGTTRQKLTKGNAENISFPLPPLTEQKRIASRLKRADRLRQLSRTAHDLGDSLLQSTFLEMFGDVIRNDKGWKLMSLGQTCDEIYRYPTFYGFDYVEEGVPVVRIGDILLNGEVNPNLENYVRIPREINKRFPRTILELGDILMAVRGDGSTGKRIGVVKSKSLVGSNISPNLLRFKAKEKYVSSSYLFTFMTSSGGQELIDRYITRTAKKTITSADIQTIKIPVPPLSLQEEFAGVVARVESLRGRMSEAGRQVEGLFESLLSEAFEQ